MSQPFNFVPHLPETIPLWFSVPSSQFRLLTLIQSSSPDIYTNMGNTAPFTLPETIALLERTPAAFNALLRGLPDIWAQRNEGGDTWRPFDVIGHLIHGERTDWMGR